MLWRIYQSSIPQSSSLVDEQLSQKLLLHLRYARLSTVLVQIQSRQQSYVITEGCAGCRTQRCQPGCHARLLQRTLRSYGIDMQLVPQGLAARPYRQLLLAYPTAQARILDSQSLTGWPELRLQLSWSIQANKLRAIMLLALAAGQSSALAMLREHGWRALPLPWPLVTAYACRPFPGHVLLPGGVTSLALTLSPSLLQSEREQVCNADIQITHSPLPHAGEGPGERVSCDFSSAYERLLALTRPNQSQNCPDSTPSQLTETIVVTDSSRLTDSMPPGLIEPDQTGYTSDDDVSTFSLAPANTDPQELPFSRSQLESWVTILVSEPTLHEGRPGRVGLAASRLAWALGVPMRTARVLMVWLDHAGLLLDPANPEQAWSGPRPLNTRDAQQLLQQLLNTSIPDDMKVQMAYARGQGSGVGDRG